MTIETRDPQAGTLTGAPLEEARRTRPALVWQWPDTLPADPGAARGHIEDCTDHGALDDSPTRMPEPSAGWVVLVALACIAAVGACALIASQLPHLTT